ncbi:unnamed protein product [Prorocentrum cordatum]|uniref:RanBP2-type domain-containing protein n=1 Tax=Prorocentrum cordatum TaxID=2364126 RepID=A0ABN9RUP5_9DINO|nr:unnamed protein product [Polarella glacialis]
MNRSHTTAAQVARGACGDAARSSRARPSSVQSAGRAEAAGPLRSGCEARWSCSACDEVNRASRGRCNSCGAERPDPCAAEARAQEEALLRKAAALLEEALAGPSEAGFGAGPRPADTAAAVAASVARHAGVDAPSRLRGLVAALRANAGLRASVLQAGPEGADALALQDPLEWAGEGVKAQRRSWARESLSEACRVGGHVGECPKCGGTAVRETGTFPAFKMAKLYVQWRCTELACGETTTMKE